MEIRDWLEVAKLVLDSNINAQVSDFQLYILYFVSKHVQGGGAFAANMAINFGPQRHTNKGRMAPPSHHVPALFFGLMGPQFFAFHKH